MPININTTYQEDFSLFPGTAYKGALADGSLANPISVILEDGIIDFGDAVCGGTEDHQGKPFDGTNTFFKGIRLRAFGRTGVAVGSSGGGVREAGDTLLLVDFGVIWVEASNSIKAGDPAALTTDNEWSGGSVEGTYTLSGATFLTSGEAGELVKLKMTGQKQLIAIEAPEEPVIEEPVVQSEGYISPDYNQEEN